MGAKLLGKLVKTQNTVEKEKNWKGQFDLLNKEVQDLKQTNLEREQLLAEYCMIVGICKKKTEGFKVKLGGVVRMATREPPASKS